MAHKQMSFKEGTSAQKASSVLSEELKQEDRKSKADNPFALSRWIVKNKLSAGKRKALAARR
jgi:hypothetical protein